MRLSTPPKISEREFAPMRGRLQVTGKRVRRIGNLFAFMFVGSAALSGMFPQLKYAIPDLYMIVGFVVIAALFLIFGLWAQRRDIDEQQRLEELGVVDRDGYLNVDWRKEEWRRD